MKSEIQSGCRLYPDCFSCPYPDCITDRIPSLLKATKALEVRELAEKGVSMAELAKRFEVSTRTIRNYLAKIS